MGNKSFLMKRKLRLKRKMIIMRKRLKRSIGSLSLSGSPKLMSSTHGSLLLSVG